MNSYGQTRLLITKTHPGVDLDIIDGFIANRYNDIILNGLSWKRLEGESVIQVPASYSTGTVSATQGSNAIVGVGTVWTAAMNGRLIRIAQSSEYYQFTYVSATTATLDRTFESPTAAAVTYRIDQNIFVLPSTCRVVRAVRPMHDRARQLHRLTPNELNMIAPTRWAYGTPTAWTQTWDSTNDPPQMQLELSPIPSVPDGMGSILSFVVDYIYDPPPIDPNQTSATLLPWQSPTALLEGVSADIALHLEKNAALSDAHEAKFARAVKNMASVNAQQRGPVQIRIAEEFQGNTPGNRRRGPWHEGFTG